MENKKKTFKRRLQESIAKDKNTDFFETKYPDEEKDLASNLLKINLLNCDEVYDQLYDFVYSLDKDKFEINISQFNKTKYNTIGSHSQFYTKMKKFSECKRKDLLQKNTPSFGLIDAMKENNLIPNPVGFLKRNGNENILNLNHMKMGDDYIKCISKSLKVADHLTELHLSGNRITNNGINPLLRSINENSNLIKKISVLDLSFNKLGREAIKELTNLINNFGCELTHINLEANALGNLLVSSLAHEITVNISDRIKYINLGQNNLNDEVALVLANMVENCICLEVLILYWNQFKNFGASQIVNKLKSHTEIKVIDFGWNLIGSNLLEQPSREELNKLGRDDISLLNLEMDELKFNMEILSKKKLNPIKNNVSLFAKELGLLFKGECKELVHLDISHNNIGYIDCQYISKIFF